MPRGPKGEKRPVDVIGAAVGDFPMHMATAIGISQIAAERFLSDARSKLAGRYVSGTLCPPEATPSGGHPEACV
jgi:hypothetical protein